MTNQKFIHRFEPINLKSKEDLIEALNNEEIQRRPTMQLSKTKTFIKSIFGNSIKLTEYCAHIFRNIMILDSFDYDFLNK
jgi:hypothetical protein